MSCRLSFGLAASLLFFTPFWPNLVGAEQNDNDNRLAVGYDRDVRPILAENCFACHGPDGAARQADLRLDQRDAAIEMGAITPNDPDSSEIIDRILRGEDDDLAMPPIDGHKRLSDSDRETLIQWVREGANYELHWSLSRPTRPELPGVSNPDWVRNPIDAFIMQRLDEAGLQPADQADRRTLARRLSLDLTGLPPIPEAVERFVADTSPAYYENYVESLLDSVRWGEHRGRYWLDYARYADTHGIHFDNYREIWAYRDWVIAAFNRNQPFDQFSIEQLAGDLLSDPTLDQLIATGFNRCNITTNEGGIIDEEYKVLYARDRTETTSAVWLGLTTGCAVCHDHKFDPITADDFYSLSAFFNNTTQAVRDGNISNTPPIVPVPKIEDRGRWDELPALITKAEENKNVAREAARQTFEQQLGSLSVSTAYQSVPSESLQIHLPLGEGVGPAVGLVRDASYQLAVAGAALTWGPVNSGQTAPSALEINASSRVTVPDVGDFEKDQSFSVSAWVWIPNDDVSGALVARMDEANQHRGWDVWFENGRIGSHIINRWPENALKVMTNSPLAKERWSHVTVSYDGSAKPEGLKFYVDGVEQTQRNISNNSLTETIRTDVPFRIGARSGGAGVDGVRINDLRIYEKALGTSEATELSRQTRAAFLLATPLASRTAEQNEDLFTWWLRDSAPEFKVAVDQHQQLVGEQNAIRQAGTIAHVMNEASSEAEAFILKRGEYDQHGERVTADTPDVLPPMDESLPKNRLGLAKWLFAENHPLTSRVTVNRFWQEVFGTGLVASSGDFGVTGNSPTHPELLDYLAIEFRESNWDVKQLFRLMVTSAAYRQSQATSEEKLEKDSDNHLLSRGPRFRMDAEMIRDYALFTSRLLSPTVGGASVRPYQPIGVWEAVAMPESNTRNYVPDSGEGLYRRSMYTFWKRAAPPASMELLNAPNREVCTVQRERTNTPLQALVTLNDPQFIEAARKLAKQVIDASSEPDVRIQDVAMRLLARPLSDNELKIVLGSLERIGTMYAENEADALALVAVGESPVDTQIPVVELATWTMLCNQMLNLDEVLTK